MKGLLKIKSIITILLVGSLIAYAFVTRDGNAVTALVTAATVAIGSLFAKPASKEE